MNPRDDLWRQIVATARWAPSPHNTQAWRVHPLSDSTAEILYDPSRLLPATDITGMFYTLSMGVFVEALDIAAQAFGYRAAFSHAVPLDASPGGLRTFGSVTLEAMEQPATEGARTLLDRRTSRVPYNGSVVTAAESASLAATAERSGHTIALSHDPDLVDWVVQLNIDTLLYDLRDPGARMEIGQWIRGSMREARRHRDGFAPACLGFPGPMLAAYFRYHRLFSNPAVNAVVRRWYARSYRGTATVGWIRGPQHTSDQWFESGRVLLRFWLQATRLGLVLHPFGSVITNPEARRRLLERMPGDDATGMTWLLFRIGRSALPPRSLRLPASEVIV